LKKNKNNESSIKSGAILSYIKIFIYIVTGLIYAPWMLNKIGQSDYALYILANSVIAIFLLDLGLSNAVARFTSKYLVENNDDKISDLMGIIFKIYAVLSSLIAIAFIVFYFFLDKVYINLTIEELNKFKVVYIILAISSVISFFFTPLDGIMLSHKKFVSMNLIQLIQKIATVLLIAFCLIIGWGLFALVIVTIACNLFAVFYKIGYAHRIINLKINWRFFNLKLIKEVFGYSMWITVIQVAQRFFVGIIPTILGIVSGSRAIAIFGIASIRGHRILYFFHLLCYKNYHIYKQFQHYLLK